MTTHPGPSTVVHPPESARLPLVPLAGASGLASAAVLVVNAVKRMGGLPSNAATQLLAPLAEALAVVFVTGLFLAAARFTGRFATAAYVTAVAGLALLVGAEFAVNLVFARQGSSANADLLAGPLGTALVATSLVFLVGTVMFAVALWARGLAPRWAISAYAAGGVVVSLRAFVPELALDLGLLALAAGIAGLSVWLLRSGEQAD